MNAPIPQQRVLLTEAVVAHLKLAVNKSSRYAGEGYMVRRTYKVRDPHVWWYDHESYELFIQCKHNAHGEYHLELAPNGGAKEDGAPESWFCFLRNGPRGGRFLHLKHVRYLDELQLIVRALTDMEVFATEHEAHAWLDQRAVQQPLA